MKRVLLIVPLLIVLSGGCRKRVDFEMLEESGGIMQADQIITTSPKIISKKMMLKKPLKKMSIKNVVSAPVEKEVAFTEEVTEPTVLESQVSPGNLSYDIPLDMVYGKGSRVILRVDSKVSDALTAGMSDCRRSEQVDISTTMRAVLTGGGFEIDTTLSSSVQVRKFNRPTEWKWDVKPVKFGKQKLRLKLTCILKRHGYTDENYDLDVFEVERDIKVDHWILFKDIVSKRWKEIMGAIFGSGIFGWIIARIRKKFKKKLEDIDG